MMAQYTPIEDRFESYVGAVDSVELKYASDYSATLTALDSGTADVAETGPFAAALGVKNERAGLLESVRNLGDANRWFGTSEGN
ncbi:PhnD/SsuA/transferrin family substrate-binding protein [Haladaptatus salinisoli]|uniref:PhnD/SsuA/transferrin family substrate-binding protein n=1 Tax=Haladaptatus salinisoli TaxID=2884876 RepID=UPI001D0A862C|nr:PhnD/SsuA/transferrin family substrate-binding protein [Haladaptatus salinisoli]